MRVRQLFELDPVELDVLPGGEMAVAAVVAARDMRQHAHLLRRQRAVGDGDPQHVGVQLQIDAVHQPQRLELVLGQFAGQPPRAPDRGIRRRARRPACGRNRRRRYMAAQIPNVPAASKVGPATPDALAQIARLRCAVRRRARPARHRRRPRATSSASARCQQLRRGRRGASPPRRRRARVVQSPSSGAIDHGAVAEPVGGDHDRAVDLEFLLFVRRGHAATCALRNSSASRHGAECATTSPMTSSAGPSPAAAASFGKIVEPADRGARVGPRAARKHRRRRRRIAAGRDQPVAHRGRRGEPHIDHHRRLRIGEAGPVDALRPRRRDAR